MTEGRVGQDAIVLGAFASALDIARDLVFEQRAGGDTALSARR